MKVGKYGKEPEPAQTIQSGCSWPSVLSKSSYHRIPEEWSKAELREKGRVEKLDGSGKALLGLT